MMKKRFTFYLGGQQIGQKDLNKDLKKDDQVTVKGKAYIVLSVTHKSGNEYDVDVKAG